MLAHDALEQFLINCPEQRPSFLTDFGFAQDFQKILKIGADSLQLIVASTVDKACVFLAHSSPDGGLLWGTAHSCGTYPELG